MVEKTADFVYNENVMDFCAEFIAPLKIDRRRDDLRMASGHKVNKVSAKAPVLSACF